MPKRPNPTYQVMKSAEDLSMENLHDLVNDIRAVIFLKSDGTWDPDKEVFGEEFGEIINLFHHYELDPKEVDYFVHAGVRVPYKRWATPKDVPSNCGECTCGLVGNVEAHMIEACDSCDAFVSDEDAQKFAAYLDLEVDD